jgi:integron integrase
MECPKKETLRSRFTEEMRMRHNSLRTESAYWRVIAKFVGFTKAKCCADLAVDSTEKVRAFMSALNQRDIAASTSNVAFSALLFLYRDVLKVPLGTIGEIPRAKRKHRIPDVVTHEQAVELISALRGDARLAAQVMYGAGLRVLEALRLRVKDIDFAGGTLTVREGKGDEDRRLPLPVALRGPLQRQIDCVKALHRLDKLAGFGEVQMPHSLAKKYPKAAHELKWQFIFPATKRAIDPRDGREKRHHLSAAGIQKAFAKVGKLTPHSLRHAYAGHLFLTGHDLPTVQKCLGHKDPETTLIYTSLFKRGLPVVRSPLD